MEKDFQIEYRKLNAEQRRAVDAVEGPVMVIAGPGTGKTSVLTLRIANILKKTDADAGSILALTFTEAGVQSMRERLLEIIGALAYKVHIHTFHGFSNAVINRYPEEFPRIIGSTHVTEVDQIRIIERIIRENDFEHIKLYGDQFYYVRPALKEIQGLKRENIHIKEFIKLIAQQEKDFESISDKRHTSGKYEGRLKGTYSQLEKDILRNKELASLYEKYEGALRAEKLYDFDDMVLEVVRKLETDEDFRLRLGETYQYILADEHQDANFSQNRLLELLSGFDESPNLFIVGDEKQAIFRFQGASLDNFLYFQKRFPKAALITLANNYRSTQAILDSAESVIARSPHGRELRKPLVAKAGHDEKKPVQVLAFSQTDIELDAIAREIKARIEAGTPPEEIAVIYRDNKDAFGVARALAIHKVPFIIESSRDILADDDIRKLLLLLRTIDAPDDEHIGELLFLDFLHLPHLDVYHITNYRSRIRAPLLKILYSKKLLEEAGVEDTKPFLDLSHKLSLWTSMAKNRNVLEVFEALVRESGFLSHLLSLSDSAEKLGLLDDFFEEARRASERYHYFSLRAFLEHVALMETYGLSIRLRERLKPVGVARLMTAHGAKGLEFHVVFIAHAYDGHFGNRRVPHAFGLPVKGFARLDEEAEDDERRLFYVALTRARKEVLITYARRGGDGKGQIASQFVEEIAPELREDVDTEALENIIVPEIGTQKFEARTTRGTSVREKIFLNSLFLEEGLSVTALNNYLACPWRYFFQNLIRIPKAPGRAQRYGTAIHAALAAFMSEYAEGKDVGKENLLDAFRRVLDRHVLSEEEYKTLLRKGEKALSGYFDARHNEWTREVYVEFDIAGVFLELREGAKMLLRGTLDRVERRQDGTHVVDYKTGKPQSRNAIEGKTKTSGGDYKRQLVFYKLLLDGGLSTSLGVKEMRMKTGEIDFVEPDERGRYRREVFEISAEEVAELEEVIRRVSREILELSFWTKTCDDKKCEFCALRQMMK